MGKGNAEHRADALSDDDADAMFDNGELGMSNPTVLLHIIWFFNTVYFGLRGVTEHYQMRWGVVRLCKDSNDKEFLQMNEGNTKTCLGHSSKSLGK